MKRSTALSLLLALSSDIAVFGGKAAALDPDALTVQTSTGAYTGFIDPEYPNTRQWRSIPFAEPPVGKLRWMPPKKLSSSTSPPEEHHWSTKFPPSCSQFVSAPETFWNIPLSHGNLIYNGAQNDTSGLVGEATSEDCLYLAVWVPKGSPPSEKGWPVQFFMTGGGLIMGGIELPWQIPTPWVERSRSAVVVTINYRVSIFGFPYARGLADQNLGILDQRAALEWVHGNIAAFGGDPGRIMQWGRSAGAAATDLHAYAYWDDPIAQSYYMESGTAFSSNPRTDEPFSAFSFVAQNVGCGSPCGPGTPSCADNETLGAAELDCMRQVSASEIQNFIGIHTDKGAQPVLRWSTVADERVVFSDYAARSEAGFVAKRPTLISFTANEFSSLLPWPVEDPAGGVDQALATFYDLGGFVCPSFNSTAYRNRLWNSNSTEVPVFTIQYAAEFPNLNVYDWMGAYHNSETSLLFGQYHLLDHVANSTGFEREVSEAFQDHVMAFVEDPYDGPQSRFGWLPQDTSAADGGVMLRVGAGGKAVQFVSGSDVWGTCLGIGKYDPFPGRT